MFDFLNKLFATRKNSSPRTSFKPTFDDLESRMLMSASSNAIHALPGLHGNTLSNVFYFDNKHLLALNGVELPQNIKNTPHNIQTFSAGTDRLGEADVFVQAGDKSIWKFNEGNWTKVLGPANGVTSFAAVAGDRAYAIYQNGSLHEFDGDVWSKVPNSTPVKAIDAITDSRGNDCVFALNTNGNFGEYFGGHFNLMMPAGTRFGRFPVTVGSFSAGTDQFGDGIVYGSIVGRIPGFNFNFGLYEINFNGTQTFISNQQQQFSATNGALWFTTTTGLLEKYDTTGVHNEPRDVAGIVSLSATSANDVYYVSSLTNEISETTLGSNGNLPVVTRYDDYGRVTK